MQLQNLATPALELNFDFQMGSRILGQFLAGLCILPLGEWCFGPKPKGVDEASLESRI